MSQESSQFGPRMWVLAISGVIAGILILACWLVGWDTPTGGGLRIGSLVFAVICAAIGVSFAVVRPGAGPGER